jgi:hypothetical protein
MPDTIMIEKAELEQLLEMVAIVENGVEWVGIHIESNPYECLEDYQGAEQN